MLNESPVSLRASALRICSWLKDLGDRVTAAGLQEFGDTIEILEKDLIAGVGKVFPKSKPFDWVEDLKQYENVVNTEQAVRVPPPPPPGHHFASLCWPHTELYAVVKGELVKIVSCTRISWEAGWKDGVNAWSGELDLLVFGPSLFEPGMSVDRLILQGQVTGDGQYIHMIIDGVIFMSVRGAVGTDMPYTLGTHESYSFKADKIQPWKLGPMVETKDDKLSLVSV